MKEILNVIKILGNTWKLFFPLFSAQKSLNIIKIFEKELTKSQGAKYAVCTNSCTTGILSALEAIAVGQGDEVIVPALSWGGTWASAAVLGANLVPVDFAENFPVMDPKGVEKVISKKTKAIVTVGLWGQSAGIAETYLISKKYHVPLIIDAAQMFNSMVAGKRIGAAGDLVVLSFTNTKAFMSLGEGGAILCNDKQLFHRLLILTQHPVRNFSEIDNSELLRFNDGLNYNFRIHPFAALSGIKKINEEKKKKHPVQIEMKKAKIRKIAIKYGVKEVLAPKEWIDSEPNWTKLLFDVDFLDDDSLVDFRENCRKYSAQTGFCCYKLISELEPVKENRLFPWQNKPINVLNNDLPCADHWRRKLLIVSLY